MPELFSPLRIGGLELPNRIAMAPLPTGLARADGFVTPELVAYYKLRAQGGVGLVVSEALQVVPPPNGPGVAHLGAYADAFVPGLRSLVAACHAHGARVLLTLDAPAPPAPLATSDLFPLIDAYIVAAWRALCAEADGIMLTAADGGLLHSMLSPLSNQRADAYGPGLDGRVRMPLEIIEGVRHRLGSRLIIGFRMLADEFTPGGATLQDARVVAKRVTAGGVRLLDIAAPTASPQVASFPGWAVPLANSIKRVTDVPVIGSGLLGDALLADSVVRDGSIDIVMLDGSLRADPAWPRAARARIELEQPT